MKEQTRVVSFWTLLISSVLSVVLIPIPTSFLVWGMLFSGATYLSGYRRGKDDTLQKKQ